MKENKYFLNTALAVVLGVACVAAVLVRTFFPAAILPTLDIPNMVTLSLLALLADHYLARETKRCYICIPLLAALTFGLLPWCAGFATAVQALLLALKGGIAFTAVTWLYTSLQDRFSTGPKAWLAPIISAMGIYLAAQCLVGLF